MTSPDDLMDEPHHLTRVLARYLPSIGDTKQTKRHEATILLWELGISEKWK